MALKDLYEIVRLKKEIERLNREVDRLTWREHGQHRVCRHCNAVYPTHHSSCITQREEKRCEQEE